jgi:hypothetical protein
LRSGYLIFERANLIRGTLDQFINPLIFIGGKKYAFHALESRASNYKSM